MQKPNENPRAKTIWFAAVDILIFLILAGIVLSVFFIETEDRTVDPTTEKLVFAVSASTPYGEELFRQENEGEPVLLRLWGEESSFGRLILGNDGVFYVECDLSEVKESAGRKGIWRLGDTILFSGTVLTVQSELADFSVTILSFPEILITD